jgi:hypothetical protein
VPAKPGSIVIRREAFLPATAFGNAERSLDRPTENLATQILMNHGRAHHQRFE